MITRQKLLGILIDAGVLIAVMVEKNLILFTIYSLYICHSDFNRGMNECARAKLPVELKL